MDIYIGIIISHHTCKLVQIISKTEKKYLIQHVIFNASGNQAEKTSNIKPDSMPGAMWRRECQVSH